MDQERKKAMILQNKLYGDGIHDDYPALQEWLDSGAHEISLPDTVCYRISKTLKIHSGQTLRMGATTRIKLLPDSNCSMIENADFNEWAEDICIDGGIWDMDHAEQEPNPYHFPGKSGKTSYQVMEEMGYSFSTATSFPDIYTGMAMRFCRIRRFTLKNINFHNPVVYAVQMGYIENFTVRDLYFDFTEGSPKKWNMDGVHVEGNYKNGSICNLKGACHDDTVAITADDSLYGPIENIVVRGIWGENSHSAVRLLSHGVPIKHIHISDIYGSFYTYCVGMTKYHEVKRDGLMENIVIENVAACTGTGTEDVGAGGFPLLWVQDGVQVNGLRISHVIRRESNFATPMFRVDGGATVRDLILEDWLQTSCLEQDIPQLVLEGNVEVIEKRNIRSTLSKKSDILC